MRWFKHMTATRRDEKIARLTDKYGLEGYGFWWAVLEIVAENMDETGRVHAEYSSKTWQKLIGISPQTLRKLLSFCSVLGLFSVSFSEDLIRVEIPNILKYRDEWSRKKSKHSGATPEQLRSKDTDTDTDTDTDPDKEVLHSVGEDADSVQNATPSKPPVFELPLKSKKGDPPKIFEVTKEIFEVWQDAYPLVDVRHELKEIKAWLLSNPNRRPAKDMARFVNLWLGRKQDKHANTQARQNARASPSAPTQSWIERQNEQTRREIEALERQQGLTQ